MSDEVMSPRDAYHNAYRWHRSNLNGFITDGYHDYLRSLFHKHGLIRYWRCATKSLNDLKFFQSDEKEKSIGANYEHL